MAFQGKILPETEAKFKNSTIDEVAEDIWRLEGFSGHPFNVELSSPNIYVMHDEDFVLLTDTGLYPYYRRTVLNKLAEYRAKGARRLFLLNSHAHFDHVANNDLIYEADYPEIHFLLVEPEKPVINLISHFEDDLREHEAYYDPHNFEPWIPAGNLYKGIETQADRAEILTLESRVRRKIGGFDFWGWEYGRFFVIHDGAHSPGHVSFFDQSSKLLTTGDLNMEIQPPFLDCSFEKCIEMTDRFGQLAKQGTVELAMDCHRNSTFYPAIYEKVGLEPMSPAILSGVACGRDACFEFFNFWWRYYSANKQAVLDILARLGEATVPDVVEELRASDNPYVKMKITFAYPNRPARLGTLVSLIFKEAGIQRRREGDRIVFQSP